MTDGGNSEEESDSVETDHTHKSRAFREIEDGQKESNVSESVVDKRVLQNFLNELEEAENLDIEIEEEKLMNILENAVERQTLLDNRIEEAWKSLNNSNRSADEKINQIEDRLARLDEKESEVEEMLTQLSSERKKLGETQQEVEELKQDVEDLRDLGSDLVKGEASESLGEQFQKRKNTLENSLWKWTVASLVSIAILIGASAYIYTDISSMSSESPIIFLSKAVLILPVSVAVWFSVSNYSQQKKLMHEYEFKKNVALSLMGFKEILEEEIPDENQEEVANFIMETLNTVYSNPQQNVDGLGDRNSQHSPLPAGQGALAELIRRGGN
jgi:hypothetical protein